MGAGEGLQDLSPESAARLRAFTRAVSKIIDVSCLDGASPLNLTLPKQPRAVACAQPPRGTSVGVGIAPIR